MKKLYATLGTFIALIMLFIETADASGSLTKLEGDFKLTPALILIFILVIFVLVGFLNRAKDTSTYWAAGRRIHAVGAGAAIASNWMSAASFLGMAAIMYGAGYHGLVYIVGSTGGFVLLLLLMAGQIRRYGKYTASDFLGDRYYSRFMRGFGAIIAFSISFVYCVGQFAGIGLMFKWILGINFTWAVIIAASIVLTYTLISGMLGVTKNMQVQYVIIIMSFLIPLFVLTYKFGYFHILPQFDFGTAVSDIVSGLAPGKGTTAMGHSFGILPSPEYAMPFDPAIGKSAFVWIVLCFSLMIGTAGLPHVLQRFYVVPKARDARWSVVWGLFFICLLFWNAPVYSTFGKILSSNPEVGALAKDAIVVYTAQLGDVLPLLVGLLAAGAVSAAFSTVSGLLVTGASALSHDLYYKTLNPNATEAKQMVVARLGTILMIIGVVLVSLLKLGLIVQLVAVAFSLAGCTFFPLFLLGIWWSGSNRTGGIAGLVTGSAISFIAILYFVVGKLGGSLPGDVWMSQYMNAMYFAWIGAPVAILVNIIVSLLSKEETPEEIKKFLIETVHGD